MFSFSFCWPERSHLFLFFLQMQMVFPSLSCVAYQAKFLFWSFCSEPLFSLGVHHSTIHLMLVESPPGHNISLPGQVHFQSKCDILQCLYVCCTNASSLVCQSGEKTNEIKADVLPSFLNICLIRDFKWTTTYGCI